MKNDPVKLSGWPNAAMRSPHRTLFRLPVRADCWFESMIGATGHPNSFVGIFWAISYEGAGAILVDHRCSLQDAERYGGMLTYPLGHHEVWDRWRKRMAGLEVPVLSIVAMSEYEEWPRGRVVYDTERERSIVYADAQILGRSALLSAIHERFGLPIGRIDAKWDDHYRGVRQLGR
jgi:hypothetical protein